jgi:protein tyrosine/serine phosphatase
MSKASLLLLVVGCAAYMPVPPPRPPLDGRKLARFDRVAEGVYRSSQPSGEELASLQHDYGLNSVLKLNLGVDRAPNGVTVYAHPLDPLVPPSAGEIERILEEIDAAAKPILIHCTHGEDHTGLVVALYKIRHGEPIDNAYVDMVRHGFHPYRGLWRYWLKAAGW